MTAVLAYTRIQAAEALATSTAKIDAAIHSGALRAKRLGRDYRIAVKDLEKYLDSLPDA